MSSNTSIFLIGSTNPNVYGRKLPTVKEVMSVFFHHHTLLKQTINKSALNTIVKVEQQYSAAGIKTCGQQNAINKLRAIFFKWKTIQKNRKLKNSSAQIKKQSLFVEKLNTLFDITDQKSIETNNTEKKIFLTGQKSLNRRGIFSVDPPPKPEENSIRVMDEIEINLPVSNEAPVSRQQSELTIPSSGSQTSKTISDFENELPQCQTSKINIMTPELVAALDRANVSSRNATYILSATLKSIGFDINNVNISYKTIQRSRITQRKEIAEGLKDLLKFNDHYIVHWDGKILTDIVGTDVVDRLPIILTSGGTEQLLGVPKLKSGSAKDQALAVLETLKQWGVSSYVKGMCFDTAAVNTGIHNGTCVEIERALRRELIYLPCRHHIFEIVLKGVFEVYWPTSSGPNVQFFSRFKSKWDTLDKSKFISGMDDTVVSEVLSDKKEFLSAFIGGILQERQPRDDYKELLELSLIFLGEVPENNFSFKYPGPVHHARWMAKAIYSLKIFLFRDSFKLTLRERNSLCQICIFLVKLYIKAWFTAPSAILAPSNDLTFMQELIKYKNINASISNAASLKMINHLWYLSEQLAIISIFDANVPVTVKQKMIEALKTDKNSQLENKKFNIEPENLNTLLSKDLGDFISMKSMTIFEKFDLPIDFLSKNIESWVTDESFQTNLSFFNHLKVVNDVAERGVALIEEYNKCLTKNEEQLQYLLQVVKDHRLKYPNCNKYNLTKSYI